MTNEEITNKIKEIHKIEEEGRRLGYGHNLSSIESSLIDMDVLDIKWGEPLIIPKDFRISKNCHLTNSAIGYKPDKETWYITWDNGNVGAYQFVWKEEDYDAVQDVWKEFINILHSYNPLDYDPYNCDIIYDVENGKRLMNNYDDICKNICGKMDKVIKQKEFERVTAEYERLKQEFK